MTPAALALHNNFRTAAAALRRDLVRSIHYLTAVAERNVHRMLGFDSIVAYGAEVGGFTANQTRAFLKIGRRLQGLPALKRALVTGELSWSKAEIIAPLANQENEDELIALAGRVGVRELDRRLAEAQRTETPVRPDGRPDADLSDKSKARTIARSHGGPPAMPDAAPGLKAPAASPANHDARPPAKAPRAKAAPRQDGTPGPPARCHVTFSFTPEQYSRWEALNRHHGAQDKEDLLLEGLAGLESGAVKAGSGGPAHLIVIHECPACGQARIENSRGSFPVERPLIESARCDATIQDPAGHRRASIPPRLRRQVLARDRHRCRNSGCRHTGFLQIHHRIPLAQGGRTELDNLVTLCGRCHRRLHAAEEGMRRDCRDPLDM